VGWQARRREMRGDPWRFSGRIELLSAEFPSPDQAGQASGSFM
jgi:hypothetical protein